LLLYLSYLFGDPVVEPVAPVIILGDAFREVVGFFLCTGDYSTDYLRFYPFFVVIEVGSTFML
jgi:hypothetical protein